MSRMVVPFMAFVAACGMALVLAIQHVRREPPVDTKAATAAPAVSKPASGARDQGPAALAAAQAKADALAAALAGSPVPPDSGGYATASCMIARSRINPDNSLWSRPGFPQALTI